MQVGSTWCGELHISGGCSFPSTLQVALKPWPPWETGLLCNGYAWYGLILGEFDGIWRVSKWTWIPAMLCPAFAPWHEFLDPKCNKTRPKRLRQASAIVTQNADITVVLSCFIYGLASALAHILHRSLDHAWTVSQHQVASGPLLNPTLGALSRLRLQVVNLCISGIMHPEVVREKTIWSHCGPPKPKNPVVRRELRSVYPYSPHIPHLIYIMESQGATWSFLTI